MTICGNSIRVASGHIAYYRLPVKYFTPMTIDWSEQTISPSWALKQHRLQISTEHFVMRIIKASLLTGLGLIGAVTRRPAVARRCDNDRQPAGPGKYHDEPQEFKRADSTLKCNGVMTRV
jgi:hypothetical protein